MNIPSQRLQRSGAMYLTDGCRDKKIEGFELRPFCAMF